MGAAGLLVIADGSGAAGARSGLVRMPADDALARDHADALGPRTPAAAMLPRAAAEVLLANRDISRDTRRRTAE